MTVIPIIHHLIARAATDVQTAKESADLQRRLGQKSRARAANARGKRSLDRLTKLAETSQRRDMRRLYGTRRKKP